MKSLGFQDAIQVAVSDEYRRDQAITGRCRAERMARKVTLANNGGETLVAVKRY